MTAYIPQIDFEHAVYALCGALVLLVGVWAWHEFRHYHGGRNDPRP